jgi:hypothetical protein
VQRRLLLEGWQLPVTCFHEHTCADWQTGGAAPARTPLRTVSLEPAKERRSSGELSAVHAPLSAPRAKHRRLHQQTGADPRAHLRLSAHSDSACMVRYWPHVPVTELCLAVLGIGNIQFQFWVP